MKRFLSGLIWLALAGPLAAQTPGQTPGQTPTNAALARETGVQTVCHTGGACGGSCCAESCGPEKVCVPECYIKKTPRTVYGSKCIDYCLPKCSGLSLFGHGCGSGGSWDSCGNCCNSCTNCGCVRTKHVLLKKIVEDECPATKCVVQLTPGCVSAPAAPAVTMPPAERVPAPLPKTR